MSSPDLCRIYLVLAIGLVMATPAPNSIEYAIVSRLRAEPVNRAEMFFRSAKSLGDPASGFEDADLWSVEALSLMSIYMLAVTKRCAAYALHGEYCLLLETVPKLNLVQGWQSDRRMLLAFTSSSPNRRVSLTENMSADVAIYGEVFSFSIASWPLHLVDHSLFPKTTVTTIPSSPLPTSQIVTVQRKATWTSENSMRQSGYAR